MKESTDSKKSTDSAVKKINEELAAVMAAYPVGSQHILAAGVPQGEVHTVRKICIDKAGRVVVKTDKDKFPAAVIENILFALHVEHVQKDMRTALQKHARIDFRSFVWHKTGETIHRCSLPGCNGKIEADSLGFVVNWAGFYDEKHEERSTIYCGITCCNLDLGTDF